MTTFKISETASLYTEVFSQTKKKKKIKRNKTKRNKTNKITMQFFKSPAQTPTGASGFG